MVSSPTPFSLPPYSRQVVARRVASRGGGCTWETYSDRQPLGEASAFRSPSASPIREAERPSPSRNNLPPPGGARASVSPSGGDRLCLSMLRPFPSAAGPELPQTAREAYASWMATTGEIGQEEVGEAEEASFVARLPGRLVSNVPDGQGGSNVVFTLDADGAAGGARECHIRVVQLLPLSGRLRAKGSVVLGPLVSRWPTAGGVGSGRSVAGPPEESVYTIVAQGAGSFFVQVSSAWLEGVSSSEWSLSGCARSVSATRSNVRQEGRWCVCVCGGGALVGVCGCGSAGGCVWMGQR